MHAPAVTHGGETGRVAESLADFRARHVTVLEPSRGSGCFV
jgi:hypothetical protein